LITRLRKTIVVPAIKYTTGLGISQGFDGVSS